MNDSLTSVTSLLSLGLVFPTVMLGIVVLWIWYPAAIKALYKLDRDANDWFILGVFSGFSGAIIYGLYWFIYWLSSYMGLDITPSLSEKGIIVNICSQQIMGILAAYCHIKAAELSLNRNGKSVNKLLVACNLVGVSLMVFFFIIKGLL